MRVTGRARARAARANDLAVQAVPWRSTRQAPTASASETDTRMAEGFGIKPLASSTHGASPPPNAAGRLRTPQEYLNSRPGHRAATRGYRPGSTRLPQGEGGIQIHRAAARGRPHSRQTAPSGTPRRSYPHCSSHRCRRRRAEPSVGSALGPEQMHHQRTPQTSVSAIRPGGRMPVAGRFRSIVQIARQYGSRLNAAMPGTDDGRRMTMCTEAPS